MPVDLFLALLLFVPALDRHQDYMDKERLLAEARRSCQALERDVDAQGEEIDRLIRVGREEQARALLRKAHASSEALTECRRRERSLDKVLREMIPEVRREVEAEVDRWLASALPRPDVYAKLGPLLDLLSSLGLPAGCPVDDYDEVEFSAEEAPAVLEVKRLLVRDILERIVRNKAANEAKVKDLEGERDLRRQLTRFMTGLEVEGGTSLYEVRRSDMESRERLRQIEEELRACGRAIGIGETLRLHWEERLKALERASALWTIGLSNEPAGTCASIPNLLRQIESGNYPGRNGRRLPRRDGCFNREAEGHRPLPSSETNQS